MFNPFKYTLVITLSLGFFVTGLSVFCTETPSRFFMQCGTATFSVQLPHTIIHAWKVQSLASLMVIFVLTQWSKARILNFTIAVAWFLCLLIWILCFNDSKKIELCRPPLSKHNLNWVIDSNITQTIQFHSPALYFLPEDQWPPMMNVTQKHMLENIYEQLVDHPCSNQPWFIQKALSYFQQTECDVLQDAFIRDYQMAAKNISWLTLREELEKMMQNPSKEKPTHFFKNCPIAFPLPPWFLLAPSQNGYEDLRNWFQQAVSAVRIFSKQTCSSLKETEVDNNIFMAVIRNLAYLENSPTETERILKIDTLRIFEKGCKNFLFKLPLTDYEAIESERYQPLDQVWRWAKEYFPIFLVTFFNVLLTLPLILEQDIHIFFLNLERKHQDQKNIQLVQLYENIHLIPQSTWEKFIELLVNPRTRKLYGTPVFSKNENEIHLKEKSVDDEYSVIHQRAKQQINILQPLEKDMTNTLAGKLQATTKKQLLDTLWHLSESDEIFSLDPVMLPTGWSYNRAHLLAFWNYAIQGTMPLYATEYNYICPKCGLFLGVQQPALPKDTLIAAQIELLLAVPISEDNSDDEDEDDDNKDD